MDFHVKYKFVFFYLFICFYVWHNTFLRQTVKKRPRQNLRRFFWLRHGLVFYSQNCQRTAMGTTPDNVVDKCTSIPPTTTILGLMTSHFVLYSMMCRIVSWILYMDTFFQICISGILVSIILLANILLVNVLYYRIIHSGPRNVFQCPMVCNCLLLALWHKFSHMI